jgi:hypothetical protein
VVPVSDHGERTVHAAPSCEQPSAPDNAPDLVALIAAGAGRIALLLGALTRWVREPGCTLVPVELPAGPVAPYPSVEQAIAAHARHWLGAEALPRAHPWRYGPSARHAVDRARVATVAVPAPLVLVPRLVPDEGASTGARQLTIGMYHVALTEEPRPGGGSAGLLWLPFETLRQVVRGLPLTDALTHEGVELVAASGKDPPPDALLYLPADYGERYLLRVLAKYGSGVLLQAE